MSIKTIDTDYEGYGGISRRRSAFTGGARYTSRPDTKDSSERELQRHSVKLVLPMPPSANRYWRMWQGRMVVSTEARNYKEQAGWIAKGAQADVITGDVALTLRVFRPQKRGDLDNCVKVLVDSLKGIIFEDDDQVTEIHAFLGDDKHNPRVEVEVKEL